MKFLRSFPGKKLNQPYLHVSVDDVIWLFENINHFHYQSIFEQPLLDFFRRMHNQYGIVVSFYCFYEFQGHCLTEMPDVYKDEFSANSDWLRFGFHGYDGDTKYSKCNVQKAHSDYDLVINEILRFTGTRRCIDTVPRIHFFSGSREALSAMSKSPCGIRGVLCADDDKVSYYLSDSQNSFLKEKDLFIDSGNSLRFLETNIRVEHIENMEEFLHSSGDFFASKERLIAFSHEWALDDENKEKLETLFRWVQEHRYGYGFPMDRV